jgi:hypothetical protein
VATRLSDGGQNDGVWTREVRDSKLYWRGTNAGTEAGYWGEKLSLPVNAPVDIIIEAAVRQRVTGGGAQRRLGIGFNHLLAATIIRYGVTFSNIGSEYIIGSNAGAATPFPSRPVQNALGPFGLDTLSTFKIVKRNGYVFLYAKYGSNYYLGQYAYAPAITSVDIIFTNAAGIIDAEKWVDWIKVWPASVVL